MYNFGQILKPVLKWANNGKPIDKYLFVNGFF
jgi:hypothetical protein